MSGVSSVNSEVPGVASCPAAVLVSPSSWNTTALARCARPRTASRTWTTHSQAPHAGLCGRGLCD
eukprot:scaffold41031_cov45-Phaeocystis_antarctica.AAC.1